MVLVISICTSPSAYLMFVSCSDPWGLVVDRLFLLGLASNWGFLRDGCVEGLGSLVWSVRRKAVVGAVGPGVLTSVLERGGASG